MTTETTAAPTSAPRPGDAWRYRPELDGLRTLAVVTIVFFHAQVEGAANAFIVLDLFFVLSGFLVTNVVLREVDVTGRLRLGRYYARRVRRLLPAAVVTILGTSVLFVLVASEPERLELVRQAQAALVYLANWQFIADGADYFAGDIRDSPFMHFWSLSVEEQYYIVFPLLVLTWCKLAPGRGRVLLAMLSGGIALSLASQVYWGQVDPTRAYFATDARLFQLLAGAAAAVALREYATPVAGGGVSWPRVGRGLAVGGLVGYLALGSELVAMSTSLRNVLATFLAAALVLGVYTAAQSWLARGFALPWMTYLGRISYGIYLWHWPAVVAIERLFHVRPLVVASMAIVLAVAMASMSYELLETPIRRGRWLDRWEWRNVGFGLAVSVLAAGFVVGPILSSPRPPAVAGGAGTVMTGEEVAGAVGDATRAELREPPQGIDFDRVSKDRGRSTSCLPSDPDACTLVEGDGPHVLLVGDSHARMLGTGMATLAEEWGFKLSANVVSACPWHDGLLNSAASQDNRERCRERREDFYRTTLPRLDPDVVVLAGFPRSDDSWSDAITTYDGRQPQHHRRLLRDATDRTVRLVERAGAEVVIVKSVMGTDGWNPEGPDPLDCLARAENQRECVVVPPADRPVVDSFYERAEVDHDHVSTIDLNPVVCPDHPVCRPVVDGLVVWRNADHVTGRFIESRREEVWRLLTGTGRLPS